jgi:[protein-PII] uridylyltransferase
VAIWLLQLDGEQDFLPFGHSDVFEAHQFMKRLRTLLHLETGNIDNRLTHRLQETVATHIAHSEVGTQEGVESLMKEYFLNARVIARYCDSVLSSVLPVEEANLVTTEELPPISSVTQVLEILAEARRESRTLDDGVRQAVEEALPQLSSNLRFSELRQPLSELLTPQPGLYKTLSVMYELGILELLFPEFGTIKARVIRDFYHKYTVDEHTLIAIKSIEDLVVNDETADGRFISILEDTVVPYHVTLALLLHDVGKGRGGKHSEESARMAVRALRRFRFEAEEINTLAFLIRNHLAMSWRTKR